MFFINYGVSILGLLIAINYKLIGFSNNIRNDTLLTIIGSIGNVSSGFSRIIWGIALDKKGFKFAILIILSLQLCILMSIRFFSYIEMCYSISIILSFISFGGVSVILSA